MAAIDLELRIHLIYVIAELDQTRHHFYVERGIVLPTFNLRNVVDDVVVVVHCIPRVQHLLHPAALVADHQPALRALRSTPAVRPARRWRRRLPLFAIEIGSFQHGFARIRSDMMSDDLLAFLAEQPAI